MAHRAQKSFCSFVKSHFPECFTGKRVLDVGSLDINGSNKELFENCEYIGLDVGEGKNVDVVCIAHGYNEPDNSFDTIISTECFEHDMHLEKTIKNIIRLLKPNGMFLFTCAREGRQEHGTLNTSIADSPLTCKIAGWGNYYKNQTAKNMEKLIVPNKNFKEYQFCIQNVPPDLYFWGIKK